MTLRGFVRRRVECKREYCADTLVVLRSTLSRTRGKDPGFKDCGRRNVISVEEMGDRRDGSDGFCHVASLYGTIQDTLTHLTLSATSIIFSQRFCDCEK